MTESLIIKSIIFAVVDFTILGTLLFAAWHVYAASVKYNLKHGFPVVMF